MTMSTPSVLQAWQYTSLGIRQKAIMRHMSACARDLQLQRRFSLAAAVWAANNKKTTQPS